MGVTTLLTTIITSFGAIFLAELGDKTQLLAVGFGARWPMRTVVTGMVIGFGLVGALAAVVGGVLGAAIPERPLAVVGGIAFLGFALWTLIDDYDDDGDNDDGDNDDGDNDDGDDEHDGATADQDDSGDTGTGAPRRSLITRSAVATIAASIALGELGDKTQLATAVLAAQANPVAVWVGATAGEVTAASVGAFIGNRFASKLNPTVLRYVSAALFALFGIVLLWSAR